MLEQIMYLQSICSAFAIEVNAHKILNQPIGQYVQKYISEVDESVIEEMIDTDTIINVKAWIRTDKISCVDFHLESAIETVYEAVIELTKIHPDQIREQQIIQENSHGFGVNVDDFIWMQNRKNG